MMIYLSGDALQQNHEEPHLKRRHSHFIHYTNLDTFYSSMLIMIGVARKVWRNEFAFLGMYEEVLINCIYLE
jgi:hypothetical protein